MLSMSFEEQVRLSAYYFSAILSYGYSLIRVQESENSLDNWMNAAFKHHSSSNTPFTSIVFTGETNCRTWNTPSHTQFFDKFWTKPGYPLYVLGGPQFSYYENDKAYYDSDGNDLNLPKGNALFDHWEKAGADFRGIELLKVKERLPVHFMAIGDFMRIATPHPPLPKSNPSESYHVFQVVKPQAGTDPCLLAPQEDLKLEPAEGCIEAAECLMMDLEAALPEEERHWITSPAEIKQDDALVEYDTLQELLDKEYEYERANDVADQLLANSN